MPTGVGYTIQVPIRSLDAQDVKDAFAFYYNYQEKVDLGLGVLENNPVTKEDFVTSCCTQFMLNIYKNYMVEKAELDAKNLAVEQANVRSQDVTVWFDTLRSESYPVNPYTDYPTAISGLAFTTNMVTAMDITLEGTDPNNLPLSYEVVESPYFTTLTNESVVSLTPSSDFYGNTVMSFRATNGTKFSPPYYHEIHVIDTRPIASDMSLVFDMRESVQETIFATDPRDLALTYSVVEEPAIGVLVLTDNNFEYTPNLDACGEDHFTYRVFNGEVYSPTYRVNMFINDLRPISDHYAANTSINTPSSVTIISIDPRSLPVTCTITAQPTNGTAVINGDVLTYTPSNNFVGTDVVGYVVTNGSFSSERYNFEITVSGE